MLTPADHQFIRDLRKPGVLTLGRQRVLQLLSITERATLAAHQSELETGQANFIANALWLAACGKLTPDDIAAHPRLADEQRSDLLALLQMRADAEQWREHCGESLSPLPAAVESMHELQPISA